LQVFTILLGVAFVGCSAVLIMASRADITDGFTRLIDVVVTQFPPRAEPPPSAVPPATASTGPAPLPTVNGVAPPPAAVVPPPPMAPPPPVAAAAPPPVAPPPAAPAKPPMPSVVTPSMPVGGVSTVTVRRSPNGHFYLEARAGGTPVQMMFDTGASAVSLRAEDAERMGIDLSTLVFSARTSTANGTAAAAPYMIPSLTVGDITVSQVPALIHRRGTLGVSLLGQSFMSRLAKFDVEGSVLTLQGR
jgi:clan AA aspartic protease (TIGR02281 family)